MMRVPSQDFQRHPGALHKEQCVGNVGKQVSKGHEVADRTKKGMDDAIYQFESLFSVSTKSDIGTWCMFRFHVFLAVFLILLMVDMIQT